MNSRTESQSSQLENHEYKESLIEAIILLFLDIRIDFMLKKNKVYALDSQFWGLIFLLNNKLCIFNFIEKIIIYDRKNIYF